RIVSQTEERGERLVLDANEILSPDFDRIDPGLAGNQVHDALDQVGRFGPAGAAIGIGRRAIREDANRTAVEGLHLVGALRDQHAEHLECAELAAVGPEIEPLRGPDTQHGPITLGRNFHVPDLRPSMVGRFRILAPLLDPFDRAPQPARGQRRQDLLGIDPDLGSEATAHLSPSRSRCRPRVGGTRSALRPARPHPAPPTNSMPARSQAAHPRNAPCRWRGDSAWGISWSGRNNRLPAAGLQILTTAPYR